MAEANDTLEVKTALGTIAARGFNVAIFIGLVAVLWLTYDEHKMRSNEHDEIDVRIEAQTGKIVAEINLLTCYNRLNIYLHTVERGTSITWDKIPQEYWSCLPRSMVDTGKQVR
jgi:hypothetical protein